MELLILQRFIRESSGFTLLGNCEIGAIASLHTVSGFVCCVVVDLEDDDVICVLLNDILKSKPGYFEQVHRHDLLLVNRGIFDARIC